MNWNAFQSKNRVARQLRAMEMRAHEVAAGSKRAAFLYGPSGVGKTHTIEAALVALTMRTGREPIYCNPPTYKHMLDSFAEAEDTAALVFEEADVIFSSERMMNILKIATDPGKHGHQRVYQGVPLLAPIFVTTNVDLGSSKHWRSVLKIHGPALRRRVSFRGVHASRQDLWEYTVGLAIYQKLIETREEESFGVLRTSSRSLSDRVAALEWFSEQRDNLLSVSSASLKEVAAAFDYDGLEREIELDALLVEESERTKPRRDQTDWKAAYINGWK